VQTADCQPESKWAEFGSEVAIKKFDKTLFLKKNGNDFPTEKRGEESERLCRKAFDKECEMLSRLVHKQNKFVFFLLIIYNVCS
jgi:hypothetical protein